MGRVIDAGAKCSMTLSKLESVRAYVTRSGKTGLIHTFCISRNTYLKHSMCCPSLVVQYNHARCIILIV